MSQIRTRKSHRSGFTLIELLVAMSIFAIMSTAMYTVFSSYQQTKEITDRDARRLADLQRFFGQFGREINQAAPRPVRDEFGSEEPLPAMKGSAETLEFTRGGWNQPPFASVMRSELQRVAYALEEGRLVREQWLVLDRAEDTRPIRTPVLEGVNEVKFKYFYLNENGEVEESAVWPLALNSNSNNQQQQTSIWPPRKDQVGLPVLLQITLTLPDVGTISRNFALAKEYGS